jgi:lysyl-tRNA synthetase class 2
MMATIRSFFTERDLLEVETPALSHAGTMDLQIESATAQVRSLGCERLYLMTSPELAMKRLLAAEYGDVYQISRVFRDGELGRWHQPEFTLLEWYRVGWNEKDLMKEVEELLRQIVGAYQTITPTIRISYHDAFVEFLGVDVSADESVLKKRLKTLDVNVPDNLEGGSLMELAFGAVLIPRLDPRAITFIYDFPENLASLARIKPTTPPVAARFETFLGGIELANGFDELTDEVEQRTRFDAERKQRRSAGLHVPPLDEDFLAALSHGLPHCAGVAIGLDRLFAVATGLQSLSETISFAHPQKQPKR